ncbi:MAG: phosphoribosylaminoimidazolesuccinocarboxamide synthase [Candidatus Odinarchaeia archaeon]
MGFSLENKKLIAEGKTKKVYLHDDPDKVILYFKNDITALDGLKHDVIKGKGYINAYLTKYLFSVLEKSGIPTQYVDYVFPNIIIAKRITMLPIEVVCRNIAAGHLVKNYPTFEKGAKLKIPIVEFFYKSDEFHDPMMNRYHLQALDIATENEIIQMEKYTLKTNEVLKKFFEEKGLVFVDFKIEFGRLKPGEMVIGDELNGDSMRLWASLKGDKAFDKDGYRQGDTLERVRQTYIETFKVITGEEPEKEGLEIE